MERLQSNDTYIIPSIPATVDLYGKIEVYRGRSCQIRKEPIDRSDRRIKLCLQAQSPIRTSSCSGIEQLEPVLSSSLVLSFSYISFFALKSVPFSWKLPFLSVFSSDSLFRRWPTYTTFGHGISLLRHVTGLLTLVK